MSAANFTEVCYILANDYGPEVALRRSQYLRRALRVEEIDTRTAAAAQDAEQAIGDIARRYGVRYTGRCLRVSHPTVLRWAQHGQLASQRLASLIPHAAATAANFGTPPAPRAV